MDPKIQWLDPEIERNRGIASEPGDIVGTQRCSGDPKALRSFQDPETAWGPEGTVLRHPRQVYYRYLFGFCILPLGSWPLSSSYAVFYFCKKSLTGLEGAGMGELACFVRCSLRKNKRVSSSGSTLHYMEYAPCLRVSVYAPHIPHGNAGVGAGASLNRNLEAGVLSEAWMIFPNQFTPYFSISSSNSGNNLCTQVNRSCSFSAGFPWAGHRSRDRPGTSRCFQVLDLLGDDLARFRTLVAFHWMSRVIHGARGLKYSSLLGVRPDGETFDASVGINIGLSVAGLCLVQDPGLACRRMAKLVRLAGEDHLHLLKSAVGDLLPRSGAGILDPGFALQ
ncbi:hypothetical protein F2Q69_00006514 [Brassica cretica]|uniref:Uncharacterized protein n=1 Tax=Brassica cretica TaxID=69181 RepID=A0A8S9NV14_BRACR|nr:hypothetical protein F2Q69_00006514 [Brassica cretica]